MEYSYTVLYPSISHWLQAQAVGGGAGISLLTEGLSLDKRPLEVSCSPCEQTVRMQILGTQLNMTIAILPVG